jgi:hypothetical protein
LIMSILDDLAGQPVSSIYLDLWTRAYDESFVALSKPREFAFHAGFTSQRAERTWKQKLKILKDLHFIDLKSGPSGPESYALILNPYLVIRAHHETKTHGLREDKFNALAARALEVGDKTFAPAPAGTAAVPAAVPPVASVTAPARHAAPKASAVRPLVSARLSRAGTPGGSVPLRKRSDGPRRI